MKHVDKRKAQVEDEGEKPLYSYPTIISPGVTDGKPDTPRTELTDVSPDDQPYWIISRTICIDAENEESWSIS